MALILTKVIYIFLICLQNDVLWYTLELPQYGNINKTQYMFLQKNKDNIYLDIPSHLEQRNCYCSYWLPTKKEMLMVIFLLY